MHAAMGDGLHYVFWQSIRAYEQANAEVLQRASQAEDCVLSLKQEIQALKEQLKNINSANSKS